MKYKYLFFDLDGTVTNSYRGIRNCLKIIFEKYNTPVDEEAYKTYVGPPLVTSFKRNFSDEKTLMQAVSDFRDIYHNGGIFECDVYEGMKETLETLQKLGYQIFIATSKREEIAKIVLEHFNLQNHFIRIFGASDSIIQKEDVLQYALAEVCCPLSEALMIGDTYYDYFGAKTVGIDCLLCEYGFGDLDDLRQRDFVGRVSKPIEIVNLLNKL